MAMKSPTDTLYIKLTGMDRHMVFAMNELTRTGLGLRSQPLPAQATPCPEAEDDGLFHAEFVL
jgi:hypothetical protein